MSIVDDLDIKTEVNEFAIGGRLVVASMEVSNFDYLEFGSDGEWRKHIRRKMIEHFVEEILEKKLFEITVQENYQRESKLIRGYFYLAPNEQIKVLRNYVGRKT